jgi:sensor histidine kinase YesM
MNLFDKNKIAAFAIGALIISAIINFPHLINMLYATPPVMMGPGGPPPFRPDEVAPRVSEGQFQLFQFLWYYLVSFLLLFITGGGRKSESHRQRDSHDVAVTIFKVIIVVAAAFAIEGVVLHQLVHHFDFRFRPRFDTILFSRYLFMTVVTMLTGILIRMMDRKNLVEVENERLRSENLQIQYNALTNQMNPHFFFNSLNSLQYLLMEDEKEKSITYIEELSTVFRYILQSSKKELVPLREEMEFLNSYRYLLAIRFEEKMQFEINLPDELLDRQIPVLSLQPLVENAINHNGCSLRTPLVIRISCEGDRIVIANNLIPKVNASAGTGLGLDNLAKRFVLLTGKEIEVSQGDAEFRVKLPMC